MRKYKLAALFAALLATIYAARAGAASVDAAAPVPKFMAINWAADLHHFFASPQPDLAMIQHVADGMRRVNTSDYKTLDSLRPVTEQLQRDAEELLRGRLLVGPDPDLAAKVMKLRVLASPIFNRHLDYREKMRAAPQFEAYRRRLAEEEHAKVQAKLDQMSRALGGGPAWPDNVSTRDAVTEKALAYFREKGIPVSYVHFSEGYQQSGMGRDDPPYWVDDSFTVGFPDAASYRRWKDSVPKAIGGISVSVDADQSNAVAEHNSIIAEEELMTRARDRFLAKGIPVAEVVMGGYSGGAITARFADIETARKWEGSLPKKIEKLDVFLERKQAELVEKQEHAERLVAQEQAARAYFSGQGVQVLGVEYRGGYYDEGMNWDLPGRGEVPERFVVTLSDAKVARKWNKRFFRGTSIAGIDVEARGPEAR